MAESKLVAPRPLRQWIVAGAVLVLLLGPLVAWATQSWRMLIGCARGLGNPGLAGELGAGTCRLRDGERRVAEIPWAEDLWITGMFAVVLCCVLAAMLAPRWSGWSRRLPMLGVAVLLWTGLSIGSRGFQRRDGEPAEYLVGGYEAATGATRDGWEIRDENLRIHLPDVDAIWLLSAFLAGLVLLVLVGLLLTDRVRDD